MSLTENLPLFDTEPPVKKATGRFGAWQTFHAANPQVWKMFRQFAVYVLLSGKKVGARLIGERIRWELSLATDSVDGFKINDHHWPYYARLLVGTDDRFADFFVLKDERFDATIEDIVDFHSSRMGYNGPKAD